MLIIMSQNVYGGEYVQYCEPPIAYQNVKAGVTITLPLGSTDNTLFCNGRLALPLAEGVRLMGAKLKSVNNGYIISLNNVDYFVNSSVSGNRPIIFIYDNMEYINIYNITEPFGYELLIDIKSNKAEVLKEKSNSLEKIPFNNECKPAYIRLEDIMADGLKPDGRGQYSPLMLEKLKYTAEYLYNQNQEYYIAWIPVYAYPAADYWNDVSKDFNLYNSYFLYVLDYMTEHNGHLGLHGYTHQYGNNESAIGYEWGNDTPYNFNEQSRRMAAAKEVCHKLGYKDEFFEFPHYGATNEQMLMAEYYFDAVYQSYPDDKYTNYMTYTTRSGKKVYYIPTPADYVHFRRDASIFGRIKTSHDAGYTLSLFYHPTIDEPQFDIKTEENTRVWNYSEEGSLPAILNYIRELGYCFTSFN